MAKTKSIQKKSRLLFKSILIICLEVIIGTGIIFQLLKVNMRTVYYSFYQNAQAEFEIPELFTTDFVPQGLEYCEEDDVYLISGYTQEENRSRIYVIKADGSYRRLEVIKSNGEPLYSHSGGICTNGEFVYLAGGNGKCYTFSKKQLLEETSEHIDEIGSFATYNSASFCYAKNGYIYVGEYFHRIKFKTRETHHIITPSGEGNNAVMMVFSEDFSQKLGVNKKPQFACSIPDRIQGMSMTDSGKMILSASSVFQGAQLYFYDYNEITKDTKSKFYVNGKIIPLYYFDRSNRYDRIEILPKSEEIVVSGDRLYMLFESACQQFRFGRWLDGQYVYSMSVEG